VALRKDHKEKSYKGKGKEKKGAKAEGAIGRRKTGCIQVVNS